jgi:Regulator of ribonuclease activity B/Family of unknown function (DUF695)
MLIRILPILSFIFLLPVIVIAQENEDQWDVYIAQYEKGAGSTLINLSAKDNAPVKALPFLLTTGVTFKDCGTDGFPSSKEFEDLYKVSDSVKAAVDNKISNQLVGTFTYQCQRFDYYYIKDTSGIREVLSVLYKKRFKNYVPFIHIKADSNWSTYTNFLYPNEDTYDYMQNDKVVTHLKDQGDKLSAERQVDHWLYFQTEADRKCVFSFLEHNKFIVESMDKTDHKDYPYELHISRNDNVELAHISSVTKDLRTEAKKCNGVYDGWEASVVK